MRSPRHRLLTSRPARAFLRDTRGATMAEYAILIGVIALVAVVGARRLGTTLRDGANVMAAIIRTA